MNSHTHKHFSGDYSNELFREGRVVWQESPSENPSEAMARSIDQLMQDSNVPESEREATSNRINQMLHGESGQERGQRSSSGNSERDRRQEQQENLWFDKPEIQREFDRLQREMDSPEGRERFKRLHKKIKEVEGKKPFIENKGVRAGIAVGATPFLASYLAGLGGTQALTSLGFAGAGAYGGKKIFPNMPKAGPAIGAVTGAVGGPLIGSALNNYVMPWAVANAGGSIIPGALPVLGGAGWLSLASGLGTGTSGLFAGNWIGKKIFPRSDALRRTVAGTFGVAGLLTPAMMASGGVTAANVASWTTAIPTVGLSAANLVPAAWLGGYTALGAAGLYGLGRLNAKYWGKSKKGLFRNMLWAGATPVSLLHGLGWRLPKSAFGYTKRFAQRQIDGTKRMFMGMSKPAKYASFPFWWPVRSTWRLGRDTAKGLYNGLWKNPPSQKDLEYGFWGKVRRAIPYAAGRTIRAPRDAGVGIAKWLFSPTWGRGK